MASRKCLFNDYNNLDSADCPSKAAKVHGVLTSLTLIQDGKYVEGHISDDTTSPRLVAAPNCQMSGYTIVPRREASSCIAVFPCMFCHPSLLQGMQLMRQLDNYHATRIQQETEKFQLLCWREGALFHVAYKSKSHQ